MNNITLQSSLESIAKLKKDIAAIAYQTRQERIASDLEGARFQTWIDADLLKDDGTGDDGVRID